MIRQVLIVNYIFQSSFRMYIYEVEIGDGIIREIVEWDIV